MANQEKDNKKYLCSATANVTRSGDLYYCTFPLWLYAEKRLNHPGTDGEHTSCFSAAFKYFLCFYYCDFNDFQS